MTPSTDRVLHQALCVTDDEDGVAATLALVLGNRALVSALLGPDSDMTVEVMPLPSELGGHLVPGTTSISLAVDDLEDRVAACRAAGLDVTVDVGAGDLSFAVVTVAGLEFELVRCSPASNDR
jgi:hypothetical protein